MRGIVGSAAADVRPLKHLLGDSKRGRREDLSLVGGPEEWGKRAIAAYHYYKADHIIAESNFGGDSPSP